MQARLRFRLAGYLALGCRQCVVVRGLRQSVAKERDRTSCPSLAEVSFMGRLLPNEIQRREHILGSIIERKISSFSDADDVGQYSIRTVTGSTLATAMPMASTSTTTGTTTATTTWVSVPPGSQHLFCKGAARHMLGSSYDSFVDFIPVACKADLVYLRNG